MLLRRDGRSCRVTIISIYHSVNLFGTKTSYPRQILIQVVATQPTRRLPVLIRARSDASTHSYCNH